MATDRNRNRFKDYDDEVREAVKGFERMLRQGESRYFDLDEMEMICDFYLENEDADSLKRAVDYGQTLFPKSEEMELRRSHWLCTQERYDEALRILQGLEERNPDYTDVAYALGAVFSVKGDSQKSIEYYLKASSDGCELGTIYNNVGDEYMKLQQYEHAKRYYMKALSMNAEDDYTIGNLYSYFLESGHMEESVDFFRQFVEEHPYSYEGWYALADSYYSLMMWEKAIDALQFCLAIKPDFIDASLELSDIYVCEGNYQKAVSVLHDACALTDQKAMIYYEIADIFMRQNNYETTMAYLRKAVEKDPKMSSAWMQMSRVFSITGYYEAAVDTANHALRLDPNNSMNMTQLAKVHLRYNHSEEAERLFLRAIAIEDQLDFPWLQYADFLIGERRMEDALQVLNSGMRNCQNALEFYLRIAYCHFALGQRNRLFNAVRACAYESPTGTKELLECYPEMATDIDVMNIIDSFKKEGEQY